MARWARYDGAYRDRLYRSGQLRRLDNGAVDRSAVVYRKAIVLVPSVAAAVLAITLLLAVSP